MKKQMLMNVLQPEESRIAILENGGLEELYVERNSLQSYVGNIYKGRVVNIEPSIQAAFVDFGVGRNGFLHISDVEFEYFKHLVEGREDEFDDDDEEEDDGPRRGRSRGRAGDRTTRGKPPIQEVFRRGSEVLVQVIKEGIGSKGPTLSTYISIPGRYLVLMPGLQRVGVSRKIPDESLRKRLRQQLLELNPPEGLGFIIRTAGVDRTQEELQRDLKYLLRLWSVIVKRIKKFPAPVDIYEESDMITRTIRDIYTNDIDEIIIDEPRAYERAREFVNLVLPRAVDRVKMYEEGDPLFHKHRIEDEITRIQLRHVPLKGGGSIVIDQTEALVAIDVNSGNYRADDDAEENAYQVNLRAAEEISRQLRLRDMGGVIVCDFIDMRDERHRRGVERAFREALKRDRARTKVLRISPFGLIEMTRQRIRPSLRRSVYEDCPCCRGTGQVKTAESMSIDVIRILMSHANRDDVSRVVVDVNEGVGAFLNNRKRRDITKLEEDYEASIIIHALPNVPPEHLKIHCYNELGTEVRVLNNEGIHAAKADSKFPR
ncbi:MAG: Rne/Rng family ribonuclease [Planctomycetaceae bacterium]|nr:Rne/Rng family ribonuclease [Planctomycetaceae bacterium]